MLRCSPVIRACPLPAARRSCCSLDGSSESRPTRSKKRFASPHLGQHGDSRGGSWVQGADAQLVLPATACAIPPPAHELGPTPLRVPQVGGHFEAVPCNGSIQGSQLNGQLGCRGCLLHCCNPLLMCILASQLAVVGHAWYPQLCSPVAESLRSVDYCMHITAAIACRGREQQHDSSDSLPFLVIPQHTVCTSCCLPFSSRNLQHWSPCRLRVARRTVRDLSGQQPLWQGKPVDDQAGAYKPCWGAESGCAHLRAARLAAA